MLDNFALTGYLRKLKMNKMVLILATVLFIPGITYVFPDTMFLGLSTEIQFSNLPDIKQIDEVVSFEIMKKPHVRLRSGIGYFPNQPLSLLAGLEIPVFEQLSRFNTRKFGIYILSDLRFGIKPDCRTVFEPSVSLLLPVNMIGGISLGSGYDTDSNLFIKVSFFSGGYFHTTQNTRKTEEID